MLQLGIEACVFGAKVGNAEGGRDLYRLVSIDRW